MSDLGKDRPQQLLARDDRQQVRHNFLLDRSGLQLCPKTKVQSAILSLELAKKGLQL